MTSLPVEPAPYDLVVESDSGLQRVQVKTTTRTERNRWIVSVCRQSYVGSGKRRKEAYTEEQVDYFFIVCGDASVYLVPRSAADGLTLTLDDKYAAYLCE